MAGRSHLGVQSRVARPREEIASGDCHSCGAGAERFSQRLRQRPRQRQLPKPNEVGIVNNPKSRKAAEDFENFLLEPQLQLQLAKDYYQIPAMQVPETDKPQWLSQLNIREMKIDWDLMSQKQSEWMDYWSQNIKGKAGK